MTSGEIRRIDPIVPTEQGLDFGDFFDDTQLVNTVLSLLAANLEPTTVIYCLRFKYVDNGVSWFVPYNTHGLITDQSIPLPDHIEYHRLLMADQRWPLLAEWHSRGGKPKYPRRLENACWHGQLRLEANGQFVGYFKIVIPEGGVAPSDAEFALAFDRVKLWLQHEVNIRLNDKRWFSPEFQSSLDTVHEAIHHFIKASQPRPALQILCSLVTSHVASGFNRVICLTPSNNTLHCVYAHGGNCSDEFASQIQYPLSQMARSVPELIRIVNATTPPHDDPLYRDLAAGPNAFAINYGGNDTSVISRLWLQGGLFHGFSSDDVVVANQRVEFGVSENRFTVEIAPTIMAAQLSIEDAAFLEWLKTRPKSPLFGTRNARLYTFIWTTRRVPIGAIILDLGYWAHYDMARDIAPRLAVARALFAEFAFHFDGVSW